ncbi:MAG: glycosyltransferase family 4 protein [Terriglobales bacterium]
MRIAFVSHCRRKVGGAEVYLDSVLPAFARAGHDVAWVYETDPPSDREPISCPPDAPTWSGPDLGLTSSLRALKDWRPEIVYTHGIFDPAFEAAIISLAPSALYVHNYYGTCISGDKLHSTSIPKVCQRKFGPACLLHYFPDHCGGRNPLTMLSRWRIQSRRGDLMHRYTALITNSQHMVCELERHGLKADCVYPFTATVVSNDASVSFDSDPLRLIFAGRMSSLKGGAYLLSALPQVQRTLNRKLHVTFAGDGPDRSDWQLRAEQITTDALTFDFPGWLSSSDLQKAIANSHLLVFPSIWPEPFGLSGLEAGLLGVPAVAFAVGGIPEWLNEGVNGHFAPAPPTPEGLVDAIVKALCSPDHYAQLRVGACREAHRYRLHDHIAQLTRIFDRCIA